MENYVHGTVQLIELLFDDKLVNLIEDGSEQIEQKFEYLLFKFERSLRPKEPRKSSQIAPRKRKPKITSFPDDIIECTVDAPFEISLEVQSNQSNF